MIYNDCDVSVFVFVHLFCVCVYNFSIVQDLVVKWAKKTYLLMFLVVFHGRSNVSLVWLIHGLIHPTRTRAACPDPRPRALRSR